jgi:hypothetical protein
MKKLVLITLLILGLLFLAEPVFAQEYLLTYETAGLDTWDTSSVVVSGDDAMQGFTLPWLFRFFDRNYTYININTNGYLEFLGLDVGYESNEYKFRQNIIIVPLWDDLSTAVYKNEYSDRVVFTWDGEYVGGGMIKVQAVLYKNSDIRIRYGELEENRSTSISGISKGDSWHYYHNDFGNYSQTAYYRFLGSEIPTITLPSVFPSTVKRSRTVAFSAKAESMDFSITSMMARIIPPAGAIFNNSMILTSGNAYSGSYNGTWTPDANSQEGFYRLYLYACTSQGCASSTELNFTVNASLDLTFSSLNASPSVKRGEAANFSVAAANQYYPIFSVAAKITPPSGSVFDAPMSLASGSSSSGTYVGTWTPGNLSEYGSYKAYFYACTSQGCASSTEINFIVNSTLNINASLKSAYEQSATIDVSGYVGDFRGNRSYAQVSAILMPLNKRLNAATSLGKYNFSYKISLEDPPGLWTVDITAADAHNNTGRLSASFNVGEPKKTDQYAIDIIEPIENSALKRGDRIKVTVALKKDNEKISGASVKAKMPSGSQIILQEVQPGVYSSEYVLKWDEALGAAVFSVDAMKGGMAGSKSVTASIKQAELKIEPKINGHKPGENMEINARVSYQDGSAVLGKVSAYVNGTEILLLKAGDAYSGIFRPGAEGSYYLKIEVNDEYGNSGSLEKIIPVYERDISDYLFQYWYIAVTATAILAAVFYATGKLYALEAGVRLKLLASRKKMLDDKNRRIQNQYFFDKTMDKAVFERLHDEINEEMIGVEKEIRKIRDSGKGR